MTAIRDLLPAHAVGALDDVESEMVTRAVAADPALAAELEAYVETAELLGTMVEPVAPTESVRARLFESVKGERFARFARRFSELFDVAVDRARELLGLVDRPEAWVDGPGPSSWLVHFQGGPALAGVDTGFVKLKAGERFAWHRHFGEEHCLVLQGTCEDSLCGRLTAGDEGTLPGGTEHDFVAVGDEDLIFAVWVRGVDFTVPRPAGR
ncbi:MAG TPA: cupin domain-containing protein [Kofleriaceae bacterium]|nr:cupin domain-containing protein [Kofleriaceae bacterium]